MLQLPFKIKAALVMSGLVVFSLLDCTYRKVDVENDSAYPMHIVAKSADINIDHQVPSHSHSTISVHVRAIPGAQELLFNAIVQNSAKQVLCALIAGADVNKEINGKKPLEWAVALKRFSVMKWLVEYGAIL